MVYLLCFAFIFGFLLVVAAVELLRYGRLYARHHSHASCWEIAAVCWSYPSAWHEGVTTPEAFRDALRYAQESRRLQGLIPDRQHDLNYRARRAEELLDRLKPGAVAALQTKADVIEALATMDRMDQEKRAQKLRRHDQAWARKFKDN